MNQPKVNQPKSIDTSRLLAGFGVIFLFLILGQGVSRFFRLPVSGSVIGMVLLSLALGSGILPLTLVEDASKLLLQHLSLFFVPAGVGLLAYGPLLKENWMPIALAIVGGTMVTLLGAAGIHLLLLRNGRPTDHTEEV